MEEQEHLLGSERPPCPRGYRLADVLVLASAFFCIFVGYEVSQNLATTILPKSVAFACVGAVYLSFAFSNLFGAAAIVDSLGVRTSLLSSSLVYSLFGVAIILALNSSSEVQQLGFLMPACLLLGIAASVLWACESVYLTKCAPKNELGRYTGLFFSFLGFASVIGPLFTSYLFRQEFDKVFVFEILACIGAVGPLLMVYLMSRPEPGNEYEDLDVTSLEEAKPSLWKTCSRLTHPTMLILAPFCYSGSIHMAFSSGSIPLFIHTDDEAKDLAAKLYLNVGADKVGPRPMLILALTLYSIVMGVLWVVGPENQFDILLFGTMGFALAQAILTNQGYKIMGTLFKGDASAFAAQRFHGSFATAIAFVCSQYMLSNEGLPSLDLWAPVLVGFLALGVFGAFVVTGDERFDVVVPQALE
ncbi:major facilitator superfamily domain-containing protein [Obelidium mucronatum]|nr:major facilitator superfamily domain-containing protein [Obelidium mucronatum]